MGLGRSEPFKTGSLVQHAGKRGPSYVESLYNDNLISENTFSLFLSSDENEQHIYFGEPLTKKMKKPESIHYIKLQDDLFWAASCQGFAFGPLLNDYRVPDFNSDFINNGEMYSIFDSGSNTIQMPENIFEPFLNALLLEVGQGVSDRYVDGQGVYVPCNRAYPDLHFLFDRTWLQVDPEDYVKDISAE